MAKLYFYYAAMNAGKSTTLLQADFNYRERGMAAYSELQEREFAAEADSALAASKVAAMRTFRRISSITLTKKLV